MKTLKFLVTTDVALTFLPYFDDCRTGRAGVVIDFLKLGTLNDAQKDEKNNT